MRAGADNASLFFRQQVLDLLEKRLSQPEYRGWRVADVGCGYGYWLQNFVSMNLPSSQIFGLDRDVTRLRDNTARPEAPQVVCGDARHLPWPARTFDLITQFTLFSSILASSDREQVAREMMRVTKPGGLVIWFDFFAPNLLNRKTRPVGRRELLCLFPGCRVEIQRVILAPPLAQLALRISHQLTRMLGSLSFLCTHYLAFITCPNSAALS